MHALNKIYDYRKFTYPNEHISMDLLQTIMQQYTTDTGQIPSAIELGSTEYICICNNFSGLGPQLLETGKQYAIHIPTIYGVVPLLFASDLSEFFVRIGVSQGELNEVDRILAG